MIFSERIWTLIPATLATLQAMSECCRKTLLTTKGRLGVILLRWFATFLPIFPVVSRLFSRVD